MPLPVAPQSEPDDLDRLEAFDYSLPPELVAQEPAERRPMSRLMEVPRSGPGSPGDHHYQDLPDLLRGDELLVLNDTRVVPARLLGRRVTGGRVELLVLRQLGPSVEALGRASKPLRPGTVIELEGGGEATVEETLGGGHLRVRLPLEGDDLWSWLDARGHLPLPPYIRRDVGPTAQDSERYQTVYAEHPGSVAAPTAGLHFTRLLLKEICARGCALAQVTLHVGPGTFTPVRTERLGDHVMHEERFSVTGEAAAAINLARAQGRPILAVGTTVVRTLEAACSGGEVMAGRGATRLFIRPGFSFEVVDQMMTNFHLPGSTLLMLASAFAGHGRMRAAYQRAIERRYRFFSYGDGMVIR